MSLVVSREPSIGADPHALEWERRASVGASDLPLPAAQLAPPVPSAADLLRPRLMARLNPAPPARAALLVAPPGAGKSTLVSQWCREQGARCPVPGAWVTLDAEDNDPVRFLRSLCAALEPAAPEVVTRARALLQSPPEYPRSGWIASLPSPSLLPALMLLLNGLGVRSQRTALVLDDYHAIEAIALHELVAALLEYLPPNLFLILATRSDPPLPFARLRRGGQLIEIRDADLRFTDEEAAAFLNERMGLSLPPEAVARLNRRTQGWIAALQAVAHFLQGEAAPISFLVAFTGSRRYLGDQLLEHALRHQPPPVQRFLSRTAFLDRLCSPLCEAVTGMPGTEAMLRRLAEARLFLVPLDTEGRWYRFTPLFAGVLRAWSLSQSGETLAARRKRAAAWYGLAGMPREHRLSSSRGRSF